MQEITFKNWLEASLRNIIEPVPQSPIHHGEGNVWIHTRMVRQQLNSAISHFVELTANKNSAFSNLNPNLTPAEINILKIGAWLHDIGKASATTIDGEPWENATTNGVIKAIKHEDPEHFELGMKRLGEPWQSMYQKASTEDKNDLWFVIQNHMSLRQAFGRKTIKNLVDETGKYKNDRRIKLLLILILMDQSGRTKIGEPSGIQALPKISNKMNQSALDYQSKKTNNPVSLPSPNDPQAFVDSLRNSGKSSHQIRQAFRGKFGKDLEEI